MTSEHRKGGPLSLLLGNILLDDLDKKLERRGHRFARYADDLMVLVRSERAGLRVLSSIGAYLTGVLKLTVNEQKSQVVPCNKATFLGFTFRGKKLRWTEQAFEGFRHRVRRYTSRSWGVSMAHLFTAWLLALRRSAALSLSGEPHSTIG